MHAMVAEDYFLYYPFTKVCSKHAHLLQELSVHDKSVTSAHSIQAEAPSHAQNVTSSHSAQSNASVKDENVMSAHSIPSQMSGASSDSTISEYEHYHVVKSEARLRVLQSAKVNSPQC